MLKRWGGVSVHWVPNVGMLGPGVASTQTSKHLWPVRRGDVAWVRGIEVDQGQFANHHFIVTEVYPDQGMLDSVDGNSSGNTIAWCSAFSPATSPSAKPLISTDPAKKIQGFYRVL